MVVCSHPTPGWRFAVISWVVFAPEEMELLVRASGLTLLHTPVLWMPKRPWGVWKHPQSVGSAGKLSAKQSKLWDGAGGRAAGPSPARSQRLPGEEVASLMAGAGGECSLVLLLFSWLLRVSPRRPQWDPYTPQLTPELGAALAAELWC